MEYLENINAIAGSMNKADYLTDFLTQHGGKDRMEILGVLGGNTPRNEVIANIIVKQLKDRHGLFAVQHMDKESFFNLVNELGGATGIVTLKTIRGLVYHAKTLIAELLGVVYTKTLEETEVPSYLTEWLLEYYIGVVVELTK